jgi:hypothetical protein
MRVMILHLWFAMNVEANFETMSMVLVQDIGYRTATVVLTYQVQK